MRQKSSIGMFLDDLAEKDQGGFFVFSGVALATGAFFLWSVTCLGSAVTTVVRTAFFG